MGVIQLILLALAVLPQKKCHADNTFSYCSLAKTSTLVCSDILAVSDLEDDLRASRRLNIPELLIANSSLRFLPHGAFRGTKFQRVTIRNCNLLSLTDTQTAFEGLEGSLTDLRIENSSPVNHLNWNHLKKLKQIGVFHAVDSDLDHVTSAFSDLPWRVSFLRLIRNQITWIHPHAFAKMKHLSVLRMGKNEISSLKRSMFPQDAFNLNLLDFSYNKLEVLPADLFENMPWLITLNLEGNKIRTLDEKTFGRILPKFGYLSLKYNPLRCDCRIKWITELDLSPRRIVAICDSPKSLRGQNITALDSKKVWC